MRTTELKEKEPTLLDPAGCISQIIKIHAFNRND